ncbi:hypothetical protein ACFYZ8_33725 [Streptomyces sp. NPDC001668]|uniref:hypothetical protein n=1 Tax=Streptomyces sp. NPDC001668 TaxID=3364598 RepID=UPI00368BF20B
MKHQQVARRAWDALVQAVAGNVDGALEQLVGNVPESQASFGLCCDVAEAGARALCRIHGLLPAAAQFTLVEYVPGSLDAVPGRALAARFLETYANGDDAGAHDLYAAAAARGRPERLAFARELLAIVARLVQSTTTADASRYAA